MILKLNISPCPNDTFMFDAIVNGRIDSEGVEFEVEYHDIEQLNLIVKNGSADISKISYAVLPQITADYAVCDSGSALGRGNGPLVVCRKGDSERIREAMRQTPQQLKISVPGYNTTANCLMERLFPAVTDKSEALFSVIADGVASGLYDAGVLIHEGRFTYRDKGLEQVYDLGIEWEKETALPLPLGGIVVSRTLPRKVAVKFDELLNRSIRFAFDNPLVSREYIKRHAQEMDDAVIDNHIALFVNEYSLSLGDTGRRAVAELTAVDSAAFL